MPSGCFVSSLPNRSTHFRWCQPSSSVLQPESLLSQIDWPCMILSGCQSHFLGWACAKSFDASNLTRVKSTFSSPHANRLHKSANGHASGSSYCMDHFRSCG
jgi:hypothetical protein